MQKEKGTSTLVGIIIIVVVAVVAFGGVFTYQYYTTKTQQNSEFFGSSQKTNQTQTQTAGWKTYSGYDGLSFEYPPNWTVENEFYSTPTEQIFGTSENVGVFIYPKNKLDNIHINGRQNSCDTSENHTKCVSKNGHIIFTDSKSQEILSNFDRIASTLKLNMPVSQTSNWKIYKNNEYGFEFEYPGELNLKNTELVYGCGTNLNGYGMYLENKQYGEILDILVTCGKINTTSGIPVYQTMIGNKSGYEYSSVIYNSSNPPVEIPGAKAFRSMVDLGGDKFMQIDFDNRHPDLNYIKEILSTFKFTK